MNYENEFWDLYDTDTATCIKLETIMKELGIDFTDDPSDENRVMLTDEEYAKVVDEYYKHYKKPLTDDEFIEKVRSLLESEFDSVRTFEEVGMLTMNRGLEVTHDGKEYQLELLGSYR